MAKKEEEKNEMIQVPKCPFHRKPGKKPNRNVSCMVPGTHDRRAPAVFACPPGHPSWLEINAGRPWNPRKEQSPDAGKKEKNRKEKVKKLDKEPHRTNLRHGDL
jgi:hypothetical protein